MSENWVYVTKDELYAWIKAYPRPLSFDVLTIGEPARASWHDMSLSDDGAAGGKTLVAAFWCESYGPEQGYRHRTDVISRCDQALTIPNTT